MSTRKSLALSFLDRYAGLAIGVASTIVLARLLTPADVGVFSVVMALLALAATVRDFGAGNYLVQEPELTHDRIRAVWAVQLALGFLLAALVALASAPMATFYNDSRMRPIMLVLAVNYLVNPFGSITYAWLIREMRYGAIAAMRVSASLAGALVAVGLAYQGHGPISLAWGNLASTTANAAVAVLFRPRGYPWFPGLREIRRVLSFGGQLTATSVFNTIAAGAPEFFLGKLQNLAAAGYYSRANGVVAMFSRLVTDAVYPVALSLFSREARLGQDFSASFLRALAYITALSWSFSAALICLAHPTVRLLYGTQWDNSVELTRWLAVVLALMAPVPLCTAALVGAGQVRPMLLATVITFVSTAAAAGAGASLGLPALGMCLVVASVVSITAWLIATQQVVQFQWRALAGVSTRSAFVTLVTAVAPATALLWFGSTPAHALPPLALGTAGGAAGFLLAVMFLPHPLADELRRVVTTLRRRKAKGESYEP